jgi:hypothetical protein
VKCSSAIGLAFAISALGSATASAQDTSRLKTDEPVVVTLMDGTSVRGTIGSVTPSLLTVRTDQITRDLQLSHVREVRTTDDSIVDGVIKGALIGVGAAIPFAIYVNALCVNEGGRNCPTLRLAAWGNPIGFGVLIGAALDASRKGGVVYRAGRNMAIAPVLAPGRTGVQARISW